jgi:hypothetical protein
MAYLNIVGKVNASFCSLFSTPGKDLTVSKYLAVLGFVFCSTEPKT